MKKVLLDTSFIITCVRNKIDFFEDLKFMGLEIIIPLQVVREIEGIIQSKKKLRIRSEAELALAMLNSHKFIKTDLKTKNVDLGIIKYSKAHASVLIATLDSDIKRRVSSSKVVIRKKKKLEVI